MHGHVNVKIARRVIKNRGEEYPASSSGYNCAMSVKWLG